jgi:hypothetical protein
MDLNFVKATPETSFFAFLPPVVSTPLTLDLFFPIAVAFQCNSASFDLHFLLLILIAKIINV